MPTTDYSRVSEVDALIFCVPTPLNEHREPDLSFVINSLLSVLPHLKAGQVLSLESTTYPGTTNEELRPRIEECGFTIGQDFFLIFSPEREDPNNPKYSTNTIPKICGGETEACLEVGLALYQGVIETIVPVSSTQAAEMTKILENTFRAVNIALVNELKIVAERMGLDIFEVIRAAATKPFGFMPFYPGPGLGGHCIPIDPFYLTWKAREYGVVTKFIELAGEVNTAMPDYVVGKIMTALNEHGKAVKGSRILVLGAAYKKNVDDTRESPGLALIAKLQDMGARVDYSDPHVPVMPKVRKYCFDMRSVPLTSETLAEYDLVLVATDHDRFDWKLIEENARVIVDTRGRYPQAAGKVYRA
ncbi:nucleotide sugar dehydrogenase [Desulfocurvibacter africanus PCS]|uniref:Nucleotide sugar dehydrogenase n=1 Tax=Desulfocurvibacter africanus PCS TaxID=1262666 RepID=M5PVS0_DESAF|nr:nucleotide sugar dehydrogenase [Desulfocurvibacter africanus]EMG38432.1 nucleotide sugar dehydrogenase [Desulfocurvibacter africanus PCS]